MSAQANTTTNQETILRVKDVTQRTGLARATLYQKVREGTFPAPIRLSDDGRSVGWLGSEVSRWIDERIHASRTATKGGA